MSARLDAAQVWLDSQDGPLVAAGAIAAFVLLCLGCSLVNALAKVDRPRRAPRPRRESMSERHDRLDREAAAAYAHGSNVVAFERLGRSALR